MPTPAGSEGSPVLVAGGTGFVGGIVARSLLAAGRTVIVPSRSAGRLAQLEADGSSLPGTLVALHVPGEHPHRQAAGMLAAMPRRPRATVAALGGWSTAGALIDLSPQQWDQAVRDHLTSHLEAMQAYAPLMVGTEDPAYLTLNGAAATQAMAGSGAISVTGAAQHMLTAVMRAEAVGTRVRFHELTLLAAVSGDDRNIDPGSEIAPVQITRAVHQLLDDPRSDAFVSLQADRR